LPGFAKVSALLYNPIPTYPLASLILVIVIRMVLLAAGLSNAEILTKTKMEKLIAIYFFITYKNDRSNKTSSKYSIKL
jgi:hypothetical protein